MLSEQNSATVRDLNKNSRLDVYEDPRRLISERIEDLLGQMTLEEKAGVMFQTFAASPAERSAPPADLSQSFAGKLVTEKLMNHFNFPGFPETHMAVDWHNRMQRMAEGTRLGIPITFSSDPRHSYSSNPFVSANRGKFSQWCEPIGLAATGDVALAQAFADIARQEYLAIGIRVALHPMADLATEPRWGRINGSFGEDALLSARMVAAYIEGFQTKLLGKHSVACITKHFPGGGPQKDGLDPHFPYGREQVYPGSHFDYHLLPFEAAFAAGTAQIMPYYGMPIGTPYEEVGFAYSQGIITDLLRTHYRFDGVVCTDWGLVTDAMLGDKPFPARAWGVEHLTPEQRVKRLLDAGIDQLGGETCPEHIINLVRTGQVTEQRLDVSVRRILRDKFVLGLFDNPYVDLNEAERVVGNAQFNAAGELAQRKSLVLLKNSSTARGNVLPLSSRKRIYIENMAAETASRYGEAVSAVEDAELAILRLNTPFVPRSGNFLESMFHSGDLDFKGEEKARILSILDKVPTIVVIHLDRPAVIPEIAAKCAALLADFGANDAAVLDVIWGQFPPSGKLPFELPSSMEAVRAQMSDVPYDSGYPLYPFGFGLTYR